MYVCGSRHNPLKFFNNKLIHDCAQCYSSKSKIIFLNFCAVFICIFRVLMGLTHITCECIIALPYFFAVFGEAGQGRLRHPAAGATRASRRAGAPQGLATLDAAETRVDHHRGRLRVSRAGARERKEVHFRQSGARSHATRVLYAYIR